MVAVSRADLFADAVSALSAGADLGDLFFERVRADLVAVEDGRVESAARSESEGIGLRAVRKKEVRFSHLAAPGEGALLGLASEIAFGGRKKKMHWRTMGETAPQPHAPLSLVEKASICKEAERAARKAGKNIRQVRVSFRDYERVTAVAREDGLMVFETQRGVYFSVLAMASDGRVTQTGYEAAAASGDFLLNAGEATVEIALAAARRALAMVKARRAPGGAMPVVLSSSAGGTMIHEAVGHGLEADLVDEGYSIYGGKIGEAVASPLVTVLDDPTVAGKRGSYLYDDEGTPSKRTVLVENGILKGWLNSRLTAKKLGVAASGNGRRESYSHLPIPRMSNTFISPGATAPEEILKATAKGLFVTRMGGGEVNTLSGDFVFEVSEGFLIENGRLGEMVRGATLAGNGPRVLMEIDMVGSDLGWAPGTCGKDGQGVPVSDAQPTLRIPELVVGGGVE